MKNIGMVLGLCTLLASPAFADTSAYEANTSPSGQNVGPGEDSGSNAGMQGRGGMGSSEAHPGTASDEETGQMGSTGESGSSDMSDSGTTAPMKHKKHYRKHYESSTNESSGTTETTPPSGSTSGTGASDSGGTNQ